ncbi:MAG: hypothetical protein LWY06_07810 [Firmicutes bacterium]|nr:hypothetical protein [Bacillota bacterium]
MKTIIKKKKIRFSGFSLFVICSLIVHGIMMLMTGKILNVNIPMVLNYKVNLVKAPESTPEKGNSDGVKGKTGSGQDDVTVSDTSHLTKIDQNAPTYTRYGYDLRLFEEKKKYIPKKVWDRKGPPDLEAEEKCLEDALSRNKNNNQIRYLLGQNLYQQEKYQQSNRIIRDILKKDPSCEMALETQAHICFAQQRNQETLRLAEEGLKKYPHNEQLLYLQAAGYLYGEEDVETSLKIIEKAKKINPNDPTLYNLEAEAVFERGGPGDEELGFRMYEENIRRFPDHFVNYMYLADRLYSQKGEYERAIALAQKAKSIKPADARPYITIGSIFLEQGRYSESISELQVGLKMKPKFKYQGEIRVALAKAYKLNHQIKLAEKYFREAIACEERVSEDTVEKAETYFYYANFLTELGKLEEAKKYIDKGRSIDDREKTGYIALSYWFKAMGNFSEATKCYNRVMNDGDPTNAFNPDILALKKYLGKV